MATTSSISATSSLDQIGQQYQAILVAQSVTPLQTQQNTLNNRLTALNTLKTKLKALYDSAKSLMSKGTSSQFQTYTVASSAASVATATATSSALSGTHSLQVSQLAKADTVLSSQFSTSGAAASSIVAAEGAGTKAFTITLNGVETTVNVSVNDGDTNSAVLSAVASAINSSGAKVSASVVSDTSSTARLVLRSEESGSSNALVLADQTGTLLDSLGLGADIVGGRTASTATAGGYVYGDSQQLDAKFKFDGIDITRESNSIDDVLNGVTFELKGVQAQTDAPVALSISVDKDKVKAAIQDFISDYNAAVGYVNDNTKIDVKAGVRGVFAGDASIRSMRSDIRGIAMQQVSSVSPGGLSMLSQLGVTVASDGTLSLSDSSKLDAALASNPTQVADLFNSSNGIAVQVKTYLDQYVSFGGQMDSEAQSVSSQVSDLSTRMNRINSQIDVQVQRYVQQFAQIQTLLQEAMQQQALIQSLFSTTTTTSYY